MSGHRILLAAHLLINDLAQEGVALGISMGDRSRAVVGGHTLDH